MQGYPESWKAGPTSDKELRPHHGEAILAVTTKENLAVTASADHGLRVWDTNKGSHSRQLYSKNFGHTEWVTCCQILSDKRILSGAMDGKLCLWDRRAVRCENLKQHGATISQVKVDESNIAVTSSYDKSLIVWDLNRTRPLNALKCNNAVLGFEWHNSLVVAGDRGGRVSMFDVNTGTCIQAGNLHSGAVHKVALISDGGNCNLVVSAGGKDAKVVVQDMRSHSPVFSKQVHSGAVNFLSGAFGRAVVTASADSSIKVLDVSMNFQERVQLQATGAVLCGELMEDLFVAGCADGNLLVYDIEMEDCLFGFGGDSQGGVNALAISSDRTRLISGGQSGVPLLLNFN